MVLGGNLKTGSVPILFHVKRSSCERYRKAHGHVLLRRSINVSRDRKPDRHCVVRQPATRDPTKPDGYGMERPVARFAKTVRFNFRI